MATLGRFGFEWDGSVDFQSRRSERYRQALEELAARGLSFACGCSRSQLATAQAQEPRSEPVYPGTCRDGAQASRGPHALRFRIPADAPPIHFNDRFQGHVRQDCRQEAGDFVIRRRDGHAAYHLAVVLDDADAGVTEVIRGADLLDSTPRQILLQRSLGLATPDYGHLPLLTEPDGRKLAKSRRAVAIEADEAPHLLWQVLEWLGQAPPAMLAGAPVQSIWAWAIPNWSPERLAGCRERRLAAPQADRDP
jgi:glutamyl-Q tRNA(Asp) synthetase